MRIGKFLVFSLLGLVPAAIGAPVVYNGPVIDQGVDTTPPTFVDLTVPDFGAIQTITLTFAMGGGEGCFSDNDISLAHGATTLLVSASDGGDCGFNPSGTYDLTSTFAGQEMNGLWQLIFHDQTEFPNEGDQLLSWNLTIDTVADDGGNGGVPEPSTFALMGTGLIGMGAVIRRRRTKQ